LSQIVHDEIKKKLKSHKAIKLQSFYWRLYSDYKLFSDLKQFIKYELKSKNLKAKNNKIQTFVIWKNPDLKSYRNFVSLDTRSREIRQKAESLKHEVWSMKLKTENDVVNLILRKYESSVWMEYFISFEDELWYLYWFVRLLLPTQGLVKSDNVKGLDEETAIVRELHVYWNVKEMKAERLKIKDESIIQHKWFWKQLMEIAEKISKNNNYKKLSVIAWVWVRQYYQKIWYKLIWTYMVKKI
jgi:histone acetyltransferase (RNA polymerase elongator complex component)